MKTFTLDNIICLEPDSVHYKLVSGNLVEIIEFHDEHPFVFDEDGLNTCIKNVKNNQKDYATKEAWEIRLSKLVGALEFLKAEQKEIVKPS